MGDSIELECKVENLGKCRTGLCKNLLQGFADFRTSSCAECQEEGTQSEVRESQKPWMHILEGLVLKFSLLFSELCKNIPATF